MPIELPEDRKEITDRMKNDVRAQLPKSDPFLRNSFLGALIFGISGRIFDFFLQIKALLQEMFMDTATGDFLARWGSYVNISRNAATVAIGPITIAGTIGSVIPTGTPFQSSAQVQYTSDGESIITDLTRIIASLTRIGQEAVAQTTLPHAFTNGISVTISGAEEAPYNGTFVINVTAEDEFTYIIEGSPVTPATGAEIKAEFDGASVQLISEIFGEAANLAFGTALTLTTPIVGVDNTGFVQFATISGGEDLESDEDFRARIIDRYQNPVSFFNVAQIEQKAKTVGGVTRVFVEETTPDPGQITVFFTKDNELTSIIPTLTDRQLVKEAILTIKPAHMIGGSVVNPGEGDIFVPVLNEVKIDFLFTNLIPDNSSLRKSISANLDQLFRQDNGVNEAITQLLYDSVIFNSFDNAGNKVTTFTLTTPVGDVPIGVGEIGTLGDITFP